jgi:hypothetical protein
MRRSAEIDNPCAVIGTFSGDHAVPAAPVAGRHSNMAIHKYENL